MIKSRISNDNVSDPHYLDADPDPVLIKNLYSSPDPDPGGKEKNEKNFFLTFQMIQSLFQKKFFTLNEFSEQEMDFFL